MNYRAYIKLMRPKHYLKNVLVFLPVVFGGELFNWTYLRASMYSFVAFSLVASAVYVLNDMKDKDLDAKHRTKKHRPIASGQISLTAATIFAVCLLAISAVFQYLAGFSVIAVALLATYLVINILYSFGLKNVPIIDVLILSFGFVLRVLYGGHSVGIEVSKWLYLAVLAFSFYMGLGKRRNEIRTNGALTRKVNKHYNQEFLDKNMYVCLGLAITYYSLWTVDSTQKHPSMVWTIPVVIAIVMSYSLAVESSESDGDPVSVLLNNVHILVLVAIYGLLMTYLVYV